MPEPGKCCLSARRRRKTDSKLEVNNMELRLLQETDFEAVQELFCLCFQADPYYTRLFGSATDRTDRMRHAFADSIRFCLCGGLSLGAMDGGKLAAFALLFDYPQTRTEHRDTFDRIFGGRPGEALPYEETLHQEIQALEGDIHYLLSIAVAPPYRMCGLASALIDAALCRNPHAHLASDVSNENSLAMYQNRSFRITAIDRQYYCVIHPAGAAATPCFSEEIRLLVPDTADLDRYGIPYTDKKEPYYLPDHAPFCSEGIHGFTEQEGEIAAGALVRLDYAALLRYQRLLNLSQLCEHTQGNYVFYTHTASYSQPPLYNATLREMLKTRATEWSLIPDLYVSVPMQYTDAERLQAACPDDAAERLLKDMDFRTHYEAGVPSVTNRVDDLASFKQRIRRFYLGKVPVMISGEITVDRDPATEESIGPDALVDLFVSVDLESRCAVLTWYSLSSPFLVSQLFDNILCNRLSARTENGPVNFYDYVMDRFGMIKRGTPKIFSVFPCCKDRLSVHQLASLVAGETIYPDGENFGKIIDEDIMHVAESAHGMGQYDRAFVCAYTNTVLQFSENFAGSVADRLYEESITLFYIELILFEEAAIHIADRQIIQLFSDEDADRPIEFLEKADAIFDSYSKTIDFWDIEVNYPTSQKSIDMLRQAFRIKGQLDAMKRNQEQLQTVFSTKCDIIDRKDSRRMDTSLAIISVLAFLSAWVDSYDLIATWSDVLSPGAIHLLQRLLFVAILIAAIYAAAHLFGNKRRPRRKKRCKAPKTKKSKADPLRRTPPQSH